MATIVKRLTGFMSPAPKSAPKLIPTAFEDHLLSQDETMSKGFKRKANPHEDSKPKDLAMQSSPATTQRASSHGSSETPASSRRTSGRQLIGKAERRSRGSIQKSTAGDNPSPYKSPDAEKEPSAQVNGDSAASNKRPKAPMVPVANMCGLGAETSQNSHSTFDAAKPTSSTKMPSGDAESISKANLASHDKPSSDSKSSSPETTHDEEAPLVNENDHVVKQAMGKQVFAEKAQEEVCEVGKLIKHRQLADGSVELLVKWANEPEEDATYEPEEEIQRGAAEALYGYWKAQGGRTERLFYKTKNSPPESYYVFKVLNHEREKAIFQFEVQWVGYPPTPQNTSMETEARLKSICPRLLEEYWESKGGRGKHLAKRGRPAKKLRTRK